MLASCHLPTPLRQTSCRSTRSSGSSHAGTDGLIDATAATPDGVTSCTYSPASVVATAISSPPADAVPLNAPDKSHHAVRLIKAEGLDPVICEMGSSRRGEGRRHGVGCGTGARLAMSCPNKRMVGGSRSAGRSSGDKLALPRAPPTTLASAGTKGPPLLSASLAGAHSSFYPFFSAGVGLVPAPGANGTLCVHPEGYVNGPT